MVLKLVKCIVNCVFPRLRYAKQDGEIPAEINGSVDCISNLPDDVLSSIMSYLTMKDAVKTSILSRRWSGLYRLMPNLNFDWDTMFHQRSIQKEHLCRKYLQKFVRGVHKFLQHYSSPKIISFRIAFCFGRDVACDVDRWIAFVVRMGVEKLELCSACIGDSLFNTYLEYEPHEMYVFSCKLLSEAFELKYLRLPSCILVPDFKCQLTSLTSLYMKFVPLAESQVQDILSNCVNLEWLLVSYCSLPNKLPIGGPIRLKHLMIYNCEGVKDIELSPTNLTTFEFFGAKIIKFSFASVLKLESVVLSMNHKRSMRYIFRELANDLPQLKSHRWCGDHELTTLFPLIFLIAVDQEASVASYVLVLVLVSYIKMRGYSGMFSLEGSSMTGR